MRQGCPHLSLILHIVLEVLATAIRQTKEVKDITAWKISDKSPLFPGDMLGYVGNPTESTKKALKTNREFGKFM